MRETEARAVAGAPAPEVDPGPAAEAHAAPAADGDPAPAADPPDIGAAKYAVCAGQGANPRQLAPAFLEQMDACVSADVAPAATLSALAGSGALIEGKGDCQFGAGIQCHYHSSMEFVSSAKRRDKENAVGELHCIVPSSDANSPTVYGAHLRCKQGTSPEQGQAVCSSAMLDVFANPACASDWRCCDNGTLTKPLGLQQGPETSLRPDFRVCAADYVEVDCGLFKGMHGHTANVAGLGETYTGRFIPPAEHVAPDPEDIGEPKYPVCAGQGGNPKQLAPAFFEEMAVCSAEDTAPGTALDGLAGDGVIIEGKGDCQFGSGVRCHYHTSMEFVSKGKLADDERAVGELHCIVPSADANSPTVFGAHVRCHAGTSPALGQKVCSAALLDVFDAARCHSGWRCCDNGTLTTPLGLQQGAETAIKPDFRICADDYVEVDCGLFKGMHGHTANVTGLGETIHGDFNYAGSHAAAPTPADPHAAAPAPAEPHAVAPTPAEPHAVAPTPAEPTPAEPAPAEPKPVEPAPAEPKPVEPAPAEPKPVEPAPAEPALH